MNKFSNFEFQNLFEIISCNNAIKFVITLVCKFNLIKT
jgi:hypothetical protein